MKIRLKRLTIEEVCKGYEDKSLTEEGVTAYEGKLDIRPKYQRNYIYNPDQKKAVINTIIKGFPLNVIYWVEKLDGTYEVLDGQQRTMSICEFIEGNFSIKHPDYDILYYHNMPTDMKEKFNNYELMIYVCEGTDTEKLDWFKTINIAGEPLNAQELRNAVYTGPWLSDAKRYFSKTGGPAEGISSKYVKGPANRQIYLETAIKWMADRYKMSIEEYMAQHQSDFNAKDLWDYYCKVINWIKRIFPEKYYRKEMLGLEWGLFYNKFKDNDYGDPEEIEKRIKELMMDDDVSKKAGIYAYILDGQEKHLNIRSFTASMKRSAYERQKGICPICEKNKEAKTKYNLDEMEADHITPWHLGGKTNAENCQLLCKKHNREKSGK